MFSLTSVKADNQTIHYLINGKEYTIGRKNADIVISDDQSVSRKHVVIKVESNSATLMDCGSKYGTFVNDTKIKEETQLKDGDKIKIGVFESVYNFKKFDIVTAGSGLNNAQKSELKEHLNQIGGKFLNNWDAECTHLTVEEVMLTIKVLQALIDDKPLVTLKYWKQLVHSLKNNQPPPSVDEFKPPVAETLVDSVYVCSNPQRKTLFTNMIFVFPTSKIELKMKDLVVKASGKCIAWDKKIVTVSELTNSADKYLFITTDEVKSIPSTLKSIHQHLVKIGERVIPIQEICMALLKCSCEKDCNPNFNRAEEVFAKEISLCTEAFSLVPNTQTQNSDTFTLEVEEDVVIPGSLDDDKAMPPAGTRENVAQPSTSAVVASSRAVENIASSSSVQTVASTSAASKRNSDVSATENPFKKFKACSNVLKTPQSQTVTSDSSKKRKPDEFLQSASKKPALKQNPFAYLRNNENIAPTPAPTCDDNPFTALRIKREVNLDDNPFKKAVEQNNIKETFTKPIPPNPTPKSSSNVTPQKSSCNVTPQKSLSSLTPQKSMVSSVSKQSRTPIHVKEFKVLEEFKEIYDRFKNSVVIEIMPLTAIRSTASIYLTQSQNTTTYGKNFKKFKKVKPLKPQTTIISTTVSQITNGITEQDIRSDGEEDAEPERPVAPVANKARPKPFRF